MQQTMSSTFPTIFILLTTLSHLTQNTAFSCKTKPNPTFSKCIDLPTLTSILHWTYNSTQPTLSMSFTARPPFQMGWAAIALNPSAQSMIGAQTLIAFKPNISTHILVNTYNIHSYWAISKSPILYNVTDLSAEESNDQIIIWAKWALPHGVRNVNIVWQVGPVVDGKIVSHELNEPNLTSMMKLRLEPDVSREPVAKGEETGVPVEVNQGVVSCGCRVILMVWFLGGYVVVFLL